MGSISSGRTSASRRLGARLSTRTRSPSSLWPPSGSPPRRGGEFTLHDTVAGYLFLYSRPAASEAGGRFPGMELMVRVTDRLAASEAETVRTSQLSTGEGEMGRYAEIWGDMGRYAEIWGDMRRDAEIWGDMGRRCAPLTSAPARRLPWLALVRRVGSRTLN